MSEEVKVEVKVEQVKVEEVKLEATKPETMERVSKGCMTCTKTMGTVCKCCINCWRCTLNCCEALMDINIRCCTFAKSCLERIDCDETP